MFGTRRRTGTQDRKAGKARRRRRWYRRWTRYVVWSVMFLLIAGIIAYNIVTQDHRVRRFLERELSQVSGAQVRIGAASFSLLEGLHVEKVTVLSDESGAPESHLLTAERLRVALDYSPLLHFKAPRLAELWAQSVDLSLYEDVDSGTWNFEKLLKGSAEKEPGARTKAGDADGGIDTVPTVSLRQASISYFRKQAGKVTDSGKIGVEAVIFTMSPNRYGFTAVARPPGTERATTINGMLDAKAGTAEGRITELRFDDELRRMMPTQVRQWMERLDLSGEFSIPRFAYTFGSPRDNFDITLAFHNVQSTVQPEEWFNNDERFRRAILRESISLFDRLGMNQKLDRGELAGGADEDVWPRTLLDYLRLRMRLVPLSLKQLQGTARFTTDAVELDGVHFQLLDQSFVMNGRLGGYAGNAPGEIRVQTEPGTFLRVPPDRQFMHWVPDDVHRVYAQFSPEGKARLDVQLVRERPGEGFEPTVIVELFDSKFAFEDFPYPLQRCSGQIVFARDEATGKDLVKIVQLRGYGVPGGPNEGKSVEINATVGPFDEGPAGVDVYVEGRDITSEPEIRKAFPREIAKAMRIFGPPDYGVRAAAANRAPDLTQEEIRHWPEFFGDFKAHVYRDPGPNKSVSTDVRLDIKKAAGSLVAFPYPLPDLSCKLRIVNDDKLGLNELQVETVQMKQNGASLKMSGRVGFGDPVMPDLNVEALNVPINDDLLYALPATERGYLLKGGLQGRVDIAGRVFRNPPEAGKGDDIDFGLALRLHDASIYRDAKGPAATNLNGDLYLVPGRMDIKSVTGRRGGGELQVSGLADWETPDVQLQLSARNLLLDKLLHDILPQSAQESWDQQRPEGTTDLDLSYSLKQPNGVLNRSPDEHIRLALRPRKLSIKSDSFAYRLDDLGGEVIVDGRDVELKDLTGRHGPAQVTISGGGRTAPQANFDLKIRAVDLVPDDEFKAAVPSALAELLTGMKAEGKYTVDFEKFTLRESQAPGAAARKTPARAATTGPAARPIDLDFACTVSTAGGSLDIGVPVTALDGSARFTGEVRQSELTRLDSTLAAEKFLLLGRPGGNFSATLQRPPYARKLLIESLRCDFAGGVVAGGVAIETPEDQPSRYAADVVIRNADVMQLAGDILHNPVRAQLSADLGVEGVFGDTRNRHGRGTITMEGEGMYEAPIILGFFRLVNFALPVQQGVRNVRLSYVLNGDVVTFDSVEMSAPGLRIYGDGKLDFGSRKLGFVLNTENPDGLTLPILGPLAQKLREELLQIKIAGTIQEPEVKTTSFPTFQATLGQVIEDVQRKRKQ